RHRGAWPRRPARQITPGPAARGRPLPGALSGALGVLLLLLLNACGGGSGEGLDANGRPVDAGAGAPGTLQPTLASIQAKVFTPRCAVPGCHGGGTVQEGLRLDPGFSAATLIGVASPRDATLVRVVPGQPDASFLIHKLEGDQTLGDRMPQFGPYLPQATIDVLRLWITHGAPS
ncbi:MAG: hypothetical protein RLZZ584_3520, partial [Pseudomonadota bacterium]